MQERLSRAVSEVKESSTRVSSEEARRNCSTLWGGRVGTKRDEEESKERKRRKEREEEGGVEREAREGRKEERK